MNDVLKIAGGVAIGCVAGKYLGKAVDYAVDEVNTRRDSKKTKSTEAKGDTKAEEK